MTDQALRLQDMDRAYARGDHQIARDLALSLRQSPDADTATRAREILRQTDPDPFIYMMALVGLGGLAFLVYKYML